MRTSILWKPKQTACISPTGLGGSCARTGARYTRRLEGKAAKLYGYLDEDNLLSLIAVECGGHDFAVVDQRFIVDGWAVCVSGYSRSAVFDFLDRKDRKLIRELYGDPTFWLRKWRNTALELDVDKESAKARETALVGVAPRVSNR
jgi:hypothetical protein